MKNIAVISHWGFKSLHGGNLRAYFLIKELINQKHKVTILLADDNDVEHTRQLFGCEAVSVNEPMSRWQPVTKKIVQYLIFGNKVEKFLNAHKFDAVFGINLIQALPAVRQKVCESWVMYVDLWADFFEYDAPQNLLSRLFAKMIRWAEFYTMKKADKVVMITESMKSLVPETIRNKIEVIPDGVDTQRFKPGNLGEEIREQFSLGYAPVFSYQGGIAKHEGLDLLCRAAPYVLEKMPDAKFLIVGRGDFLNHCKSIVAENGTQEAFVFAGWVDYEKMPQVLAAVNVSVVPMPDVRAARPIISFKLLEAMAAGTLVVANNLPGLREIVDKAMVVLTKADHPQTFAQDLVKAYKLPQESKEALIDRALKRIAELDWRCIAQKDSAYYLA